MNSLKVVFFGTSVFAANLLAFLLKQNVDVVAVVTRMDKPRGRSSQLLPPPVKETLQSFRLDIPLYQPKKASTQEFVEVLKQHDADLFIVVAYGEIIKENLLHLPKLGCINIHASLLPAYRGAAPMQRALMDGVVKTGVTIIDMVIEMDAGDMIAAVEMDISQEMTLGELSEKLCALSCPLLLDVIENFKKGAVVRTAQDRSKVTFAPKITAEEEQIDWNTSAQQIHNKIRALSPQPGAWCHILIGDQIKRLKIKKSLASSLSGQVGENLSLNQEEWIIACQTGSLSLLEVQLEGKKAMPIKEFLQGCRALCIVKK